MVVFFLGGNKTGHTFCFPANVQLLFFIHAGAIVSDSMEGGELFSRIQAKGDQAFTEKGETRTDPKARQCPLTFSCVLGLLPV